VTDEQKTSNTPPTEESSAAQLPHTPAPKLPVENAMTAAPLTGGGPHRGEAHAKPSEQKPTGPPPIPTTGVGPSTHPPRPQQPPRPAQPMPPGFHPTTHAAQLTGSLFDPSLAAQDPTIASLLSAALTNQRQAAQKFHLIIFPENDWPRCEEYTTADELVAVLKSLLGTNCHVYPFLGHRMVVTAGPHHFLKTPYGALPLFDLTGPDGAQEVEHGWLGDSLHPPMAPQPDEENPHATPAGDSDEFLPAGSPGSGMADNHFEEDDSDTDDGIPVV